MFPIDTHSFFSSLVPPVVTVESNEILGIVNQPTTLNCQVDGHPLPTISWTRAGRPVDAQPGQLTAGKRVQTHDTGCSSRK